MDIAELIRIDRGLIERLEPQRLFLTCQPHVLVVTDMAFSSPTGFALAQFVDTLLAGEVYGRTPKVTKANTGSDASADIENFRFDDATHGLDIDRYDVCFIFAIGSASAVTAAELDAMAAFMQAGGGLFATGDHATLGAGICRDIPRVRSMRKWTVAQNVPSAGGEDRLSTNLPGADATYVLEDQSDTYPQRVYLNWRTGAGGVAEPHPLMQATGGGAIDHIPDHPHEGECLIPADLTTSFSLGGADVDEWPEETGGGPRVAPEIVAKSMSHGDAFPGKAALVPREFIAIAAYDGQLADVGRVVTDATWHHFVDINIDGTGSTREGLMPGGVDTPEMVLLREHWVNLANWLMPKRQRRCLLVPMLGLELLRFPLREELALPPLPLREADADMALGRQVERALSSRLKPFQIADLKEDLVALGMADANRAQRLRALNGRFGELSAADMGVAALGSQAAAMVDMAMEQSMGAMDEAEIMDKLDAAAQQSVGRRAQALRKRLQDGMELLLELEQR